MSSLLQITGDESVDLKLCHTGEVFTAAPDVRVRGLVSRDTNLEPKLTGIY